jgi:hypothetical protein
MFPAFSLSETCSTFMRVGPSAWQKRTNSYATNDEAPLPDGLDPAYDVAHVERVVEEAGSCIAHRQQFVAHRQRALR